MRATLLMVVLALATSGCTVVGFDTPYNKGVEAYRAGHLQEAIEHFKTATKEKPEFHEAWYNLARAYDELAVSRRRLADAHEEKPGDRGDSAVDRTAPEDLRKLAAEDVLKADAAYKRSLEVAPNAARALVSYGMFRFDRGEYDAAAVLLRQAVKAEPDRAWPLTSLGWFHYLQGNRADALEAYETAVAREPRDALTHYRLGIWHEDGGDFATARTEYETATNLDPADALSWQRLGYLLRGQQEYLRAAASLETALQLDTGGEATRPDRIALLLDIAQLFQLAQRQERAVEALWRARDQGAADALTAPLLAESYRALQLAEATRLAGSKPE